MQDTYNEVIIVLVAGSIVFLVLTSIVVFVILFYQKKRFNHRQQFTELENKMQQELLKTQLETQEDTFRQIGEELHDNVGQLLTSTNIMLVMTERSLTEVPTTLKTAITTLATAIRDLRSLSKALNKEWLGQFNLVDNLLVEVERINLSGAITITVDASRKDLPLKPEAQVMLFRIIQEALHNGIKHAEAKRIDVTFGWEDGSLFILIRDDGKGFDTNTSQDKGVGLINMMHRTKLLSGTISWESAPSGGTTVKIGIPNTNQHI